MTRPSAPQRPRYPADGGAPGGRPPAGRAPAGRAPDGRTPDGRPPQRGRWQDFAGRYGWRAYALPVLSLVTVLAVVNMAVHRGDSQPQAAGSTPVSSAPPASTPASSAPASSAPSTRPVASSSPRKASSPPVVLRSWQLPPGPAYSVSASGTFATVPGSSPVLGKGQLFKFTIDVENGVSGVDSKSFAAGVMAALSDRRSWIASGAVALQRVDSGPVDFRISLAAPMTVRNICGYSLKIETSCYAGSVGRVMLNVSRWVRGAQAYAGDLANYHRYAVNHEVGHALGHNHAHGCLASGIAPVMMQQTIGLKAAGRTCRPNPWPFPDGASDAPGAEQVGDAADMEFFQRNE